MNVASINFGGGVRVGLEDNIWYDENRTHLATNRELIERVLLVASTLGIQPYSHQDLRKILIH